MARVPLEPRDTRRLCHAYVNFWNSIKTFTRGLAQQATMANLSATLENGTLDIETNEPFRIQGVSARPALAGRVDYDVYLTLRQEVYGNALQDGAVELRAAKSSIKLMYLEARNKADTRRELEGMLAEARVHQGFHFDLSDAANHPIFHAQVDHGCIESAAIQRRYAVGAGRCDVPRIPTAPLDFVGVVYVLLHDHFPQAVSRGWPAKIRQAASGLPLMPMTSFGDVLAAGAQMDCAWWYYHKHR
jgi:hypothetical protein